MKVDVDLLMLLKMYKLLEMACNFLFYIWAWLFSSSL